MPFLTFPIGAEGALVNIFVALSTPRVDALKAAGLGFPPPEKAKALIDTGASISSISPRIAKGLALVPSGVTLEERIKKGPGKGTSFADLVWKLNESGPGPLVGMFRPAPPDCVLCLNRRTTRSEKALWVAKRHEASA